MTGAPVEISDRQLKEVSVKVVVDTPPVVPAVVPPVAPK
jgi:hypothetical protein